MNLGQLLDRVRELPDDQCIFARKPWTSTSEALAAPLDENSRVPGKVSALGLEYFLEVHVAKEVLEILGDRRTSKGDEPRLLIFYAENDAYPDWVYERQ